MLAGVSRHGALDGSRANCGCVVVHYSKLNYSNAEHFPTSGVLLPHLIFRQRVFPARLPGGQNV